jgi:osmotically-inducible protein OsmY
MIFDKPRTRNGHRPDAEIAADIHQALRGYAPLCAAAPPIQVEVGDGVVILRGVVRGGALRHAAGRLAAEVVGVESVRNELLADPDIEQAVAQALATHPYARLVTEPVLVKSYLGEVTLTGQVASQIQQMIAESVARTVPGVSDVVNELVVESESNGHFR